MSKLALAFATAFFMCIVGPATACQSRNFILDEAFKIYDNGWDAPTDYFSYGSPGATLKSEPDKGYYALNRTLTSDGTDICATVVWPAELNKVKDKSYVIGGLIFWAKDNSNFYMAQIDAIGNLKVMRYIANSWSTVVRKDNKDLNLARLSPSDKNEIEVQVTGAHASIRLNGKPVLEMNGQPPPGSGYVGIYAGQSDPALSIVFSNFQIAAML